MGMSPMGFYLRRGSDGKWLGAVAGRENFQPSQEYRPVERPVGGGSGIARQPFWVRVLDTLRQGLDRPSHSRL